MACAGVVIPGLPGIDKPLAAIIAALGSTGAVSAGVGACGWACCLAGPVCSTLAKFLPNLDGVCAAGVGAAGVCAAGCGASTGSGSGAFLDGAALGSAGAYCCPGAPLPPLLLGSRAALGSGVGSTTGVGAGVGASTGSGSGVGAPRVLACPLCALGSCFAAPPLAALGSCLAAASTFGSCFAAPPLAALGSCCSAPPLAALGSC